MSVEYDKLINKVLKESNENINEYYGLLHDTRETKDFYSLIKKLDGKTNNNYWLIEIVNHIFEPNSNYGLKDQFFDKLSNLGVQIIKYDGQKLIIKCDGEIFTFRDLCLYFREFNKRDYNNPNHYDKENYIPILIDKLKLLDDTSKLVIGYINEELLNSKKIRCWIEIIKNNKSYVIDFVNNICMEKEHFYNFYNVEIINKVSKNDVLNEEVLSVLINDLSISYDEYLIYAQEFNKEVHKKRLFQK